MFARLSFIGLILSSHVTDMYGFNFKNRCGSRTQKNVLSVAVGALTNASDPDGIAYCVATLVDATHVVTATSCPLLVDANALNRPAYFAYKITQQGLPFFVKVNKLLLPRNNPLSKDHLIYVLEIDRVQNVVPALLSKGKPAKHSTYMVFNIGIELPEEIPPTKLRKEWVTGLQQIQTEIVCSGAHRYHPSKTGEIPNYKEGHTVCASSTCFSLCEHEQGMPLIRKGEGNSQIIVGIMWLPPDDPFKTSVPSTYILPSAYYDYINQNAKVTWVQ